MASSGRAAERRHPSAQCTEGSLVPSIGPRTRRAQVFGSSGVPASHVPGGRAWGSSTRHGPGRSEEGSGGPVH